MAKIIPLQKRETPVKYSQKDDGFVDFVNWVSEMNKILHLIEKSLEKTPAYATKNLNSRR